MLSHSVRLTLLLMQLVAGLNTAAKRKTKKLIVNIKRNENFRFLPKTNEVISTRKIEVISARSGYEGLYPGLHNILNAYKSLI